MLRDRQKEIFVQRYTASGCAGERQAAIDAGIPADRATGTAESWLKESAVRQRIDELIRPVLRECDISRKRIIEQYARIAFSDIRRVFDDKGQPYAFHEMDYDTACAVAEYKMTSNGPQIKLEARKPALDKLAEIERVIAPEGGDGSALTVNIVNFSEKKPPESEFD